MNSDAGECKPESLEELGWDSFFKDGFEALKVPDSVPARVISESRGSFQVCGLSGELTAIVPGKMRNRATPGQSKPAVGDWVTVRPLANERKGRILAVLPRKSKFSRKVAGERTEEQVVSANIDTVFIVSGLAGGRDLNLRRIERYLTLSSNSGATPVIVLNKVDLCPDVGVYIRAIEAIAPGISIHPVSAKEGTGMEGLRKYLARGKTAAFFGPSGVGKSALINSLLGTERQDTGEVREDDQRGRHTTTKRELILLPGGGMVIDTPGMREIQLWAEEEDLQDTFQDIEMLAAGCRFSDCRHKTESGCAVKAAIAQGKLDPARLASYHNLVDELDHLAAREVESARDQEKLKWKKISQWSRQVKDNRK